MRRPVTEEFAEKILDRIMTSDDPDFYEALIMVALDETGGDLEEAVEIADEGMALRKSRTEKEK